MESMNENVIEWIRGDDFAKVTAPNATRLKGQVERLAEKWPDEAKVLHRNSDGSIFAQVPARWVNIRKPKEVEMTQERLDALARAREKSFGR